MTVEGTASISLSTKWMIPFEAKISVSTSVPFLRLPWRRIFIWSALKIEAYQFQKQSYVFSVILTHTMIHKHIWAGKKQDVMIPFLYPAFAHPWKQSGHTHTHTQPAFNHLHLSMIRQPCRSECSRGFPSSASQSSPLPQPCAV